MLLFHVVDWLSLDFYVYVPSISPYVWYIGLNYYNIQMSVYITIISSIYFTYLMLQTAVSGNIDPGCR